MSADRRTCVDGTPLWRYRPIMANRPKDPTQKFRNVSTTIPPEHEEELRQFAGTGLGAMAAAVRLAIAEFLERRRTENIGGGKKTKSKRAASLRAVPSNGDASKIRDLGAKDERLERLEAQIEELRRWSPSPVEAGGKVIRLSQPPPFKRAVGHR